MDENGQPSNGLGSQNQPNSFPQPTAGSVGLNDSSQAPSQPETPPIVVPDPSNDPTKQAIYTPEAPEPVSPLDVPRSENPYLSHPYFSNHPTQTFNQDVGDIIINNGSPQKKKINFKPWLIGGGILATFVIIIAVILAVMGGGGRSNSRTSLAPAETKFNQYANYLLHGSTANSLTGSYDSYSTYKLDEELDSADVNTEYWTQAGSLLDDAIETFAKNKSDDAAENDTYNFMTNQRETLSFLYAYHQSTKPDQTVLMKRYLSSGFEVANSYITESFKPLYELDSRLANEYLKLKNSEYTAAFALLDVYRNSNCITSNNSIDEACVKRIFASPNPELDDLSNSAMKFERNAELLIQNKVSQLESECWTISEKLRALTSGEAK